MLQICLNNIIHIRPDTSVCNSVQGEAHHEENHRIASKIVFHDTERTVWEMILEPGEEFAFHTHMHDYLFYVIEGSTIEALDFNGNKTAIIIANSGEVLSFKVEGDFLVSRQVTIPRSHGVRNMGPAR